MAAKIPVILDTDIGGDIDDTWALAMMLNSPELDVRLVTTTTRNTVERAKIVARMLEIAGRTDVPVGIGRRENENPIDQSGWVAGYDLARYPGKVLDDGAGAIIDAILSSAEPVTLISIGPVPDIAAALDRRPEIARKARFVGMHGSLYRGYDGKPTVDAEYNVRANPGALQKVFAAPWDKAITPLDTCGIVRLTGEKYQKVFRSDRPLARAVMENYKVWLKGKSDDGRSSILFDTVAIYLGFSRDLLEMKRLGVRVTDDGRTVPDESAPAVDCALNWKDLPAFEDLLVSRLTGESS